MAGRLRKHGLKKLKKLNITRRSKMWKVSLDSILEHIHTIPQTFETLVWRKLKSKATFQNYFATLAGRPSEQASFKIAQRKRRESLLSAFILYSLVLWAPDTYRKLKLFSCLRLACLTKKALTVTDVFY